MPTSKKYRPVGRCIYCHGTTALTDEHIIPFSLGGNTVLPKASCRKHSEITSRFELDVARNFYGRYRICHGVQTRRQRRRKQLALESVEVRGVDFSDNEIILHLPLSDIPSVYMWYKPGPPLILARDGAAKPIHQAGYKMDDEEWQHFFVKHMLKWAEIRSQGLNCATFSRALAKIGHAYVAAELGLNAFEPALLDVIDGTRLDSNRHVGAASLDEPQSDSALELERHDVRGVCYVGASISLHAFPLMPKYRVIVGTEKPS